MNYSFKECDYLVGKCVVKNNFIQKPNLLIIINNHFISYLKKRPYLLSCLIRNLNRINKFDSIKIMILLPIPKLYSFEISDLVKLDTFILNIVDVSEKKQYIKSINDSQILEYAEKVKEIDRKENFILLVDMFKNTINKDHKLILCKFDIDNEHTIGLADILGNYKKNHICDLVNNSILLDIIDKKLIGDQKINNHEIFLDYITDYLQNSHIDTDSTYKGWINNLKILYVEIDNLNDPYFAKHKKIMKMLLDTKITEFNKKTNNNEIITLNEKTIEKMENLLLDADDNYYLNESVHTFMSCYSFSNWIDEALNKSYIVFKFNINVNDITGYNNQFKIYEYLDKNNFNFDGINLNILANDEIIVKNKNEIMLPFYINNIHWLFSKNIKNDLFDNKKLNIIYGILLYEYIVNNYSTLTLINYRIIFGFLRTYYQILKENKYLGNSKKEPDTYKKNLMMQMLLEQIDINDIIKLELFKYINYYLNMNNKILRKYFSKLQKDDILYEIEKINEHVYRKHIEIINSATFKPIILFTTILQMYLTRKNISIGQLMDSIDKNYGIVNDELSLYFFELIKAKSLDFKIVYNYDDVNNFIIKKLNNKDMYLEFHVVS